MILIAISTNQKPTIYRNLYENTGPGDFNSPIGKSEDVIEHVDELPPSIVIDDKTNLYGSHFLDFVKDTQICVLNGRVTPEFDDFTNMSGRGKSVVDYILVPQVA